MVFRALLLLSGLLVATATAWARERVEEKTFSTSGAAQLEINAYDGNLTIESSDDPVMRVKVVASSALPDDQAADRALQNLEFRGSQEGDHVMLVAANSHETSAHFSSEDAAHIELTITVIVPRSCRLTLATGRGEIRVGEIAGNLRVEAGQGTISCRYIDGTVLAHVISGDILVSHCTGDVNLRTDHGGIRTGRIEGHAIVTARSGDIDIMSAARGLTVSADGGDVVAGIPRQFSGDSSLSASGGNITLKIDPAARVDLDASSVWGRVRSLTTRPLKLSLVMVSGGLGQKSLIGKINSGGARLQVHANGGHINLASEVTPFS